MKGKFEKYDIPSDEFINGVRVTLPASFRNTQRFLIHLLDNAKLLNRGLKLNAKFYPRGNMAEKCAYVSRSYSILNWKIRNGPDYHTKLNQLIATWDLTNHN